MKRLVPALLLAVGLTVTATATAAPSQAVQESPTKNAPYWGHWGSPALVYDATGGGTPAKVSEAVTEWSKSGWDVRMTTDPAAANIVVSVEDIAVDNALGYANLAYTNGLISGCTVRLQPAYAMEPVTEHTVAHELGHCGGLPHSSSTRSIMYASTGLSGFLTRPTGQDIRWMAANV